MKEALLKGDIRRFGEYLSKSWEAKKKMAETITNDRIDHIYQDVLSAGAIAGKISGAGGGGFMMLMVDPIRRVDVFNRLLEYEGRIYKFQFTKEGTVGWKLH